MIVKAVVPSAEKKFSATFQGMFGIFRGVSYFAFIYYKIFHGTPFGKKCFRGLPGTS